LGDDASRNKRQMMEVSNKMKRKTEERNRLKREITELKNAQEEEETEVDTATYVSLLFKTVRGS
jgi:ribonuclease P protein component